MIKPLQHHYIPNTKPIHNHYQTITKPLLHHYTNIADILNIITKHVQNRSNTITTQ